MNAERLVQTSRLETREVTSTEKTAVDGVR